MQVAEDPAYTRDYLDPKKRSIGNAVQVFFKDGTSTDKAAVEYPVGHRSRRAEGQPLLVEKFQHNLAIRFDTGQCERIQTAFANPEKLDAISASAFVNLFL